MSYIQPSEYSKHISNLLSEGIDNVSGKDTTSLPIVSIREALKNLSTSDREQLQEYMDSLSEIKKEIAKLIKKGRSPKQAQEYEEVKEEHTGGDMMHLTMNDEE